jgi:hypothetical protein
MTRAEGIGAVARLRSVAVRSAFLTGSELVALFEQIGPLPDKVQWVHRHVAADLIGPLDPALERAGAAIAADIDAQADRFDQHPYHNRQHFCEVALTAYILCFLEQLNAEATQLVVLAALIHDVVHDGGSQAFVQERASVERMRPMLQAAGLSAAQVSRIMVLVLATQSSAGTEFMATVFRAHHRDEAPALAIPTGAPELAALIDDPALARLARILCEADILPSVGLNLEHAMCLQERLSLEWRRPMDERDKIAFIDVVLHHGFIGDFFLANVRATREALSRSLHAFAPNPAA